MSQLSACGVHSFFVTYAAVLLADAHGDQLLGRNEDDALFLAVVLDGLHVLDLELVLLGDRGQASCAS